jgi:hypothetical protein
MNFSHLLEPPKKTPIWKKIIYGTLICALLVGAGIGAGKMGKYYKEKLIPPVSLVGEPYIHTGDGIKSELVRVQPGQVIFIRAFTRRITACLGEINYAIMQTAPDDIDGTKRRTFYHSFPSGKGYTGIGHFITDERRVIPRWLKPGKYQFVRSASYVCDGIEIYAPGVIMHIEVSGSIIHGED